MTGLWWFVAAVVVAVGHAAKVFGDLLARARWVAIPADGHGNAGRPRLGLYGGLTRLIGRWPWAVGVPVTPSPAILLSRAGWLSGLDEQAARHWMEKFASFCATGGVLTSVALLVRAPVWMWPLVLAMGFYWGRQMAFKIVDNAGSRRAQQVLAGLPEWLEDIALAARGGLSLRQAIEVANGIGEGPLVTEARMAMINVRAGQSLRDALVQVIERYPEPELAVSIRTLLEVETRGLPLAETVEEQVQLLRALASRQRQRRIEALPVWLSLITIGLLLPPVLIVTVLPNVIQFLQLYR